MEPFEIVMTIINIDIVFADDENVRARWKEPPRGSCWRIGVPRSECASFGGSRWATEGVCLRKILSSSFSSVKSASAPLIRR